MNRKLATIAFSAALALTGCLSDDDDSDGGSNGGGSTTIGTQPTDISLSQTQAVVAIDEAAGTYTTIDTYSYCEDGELVTETDTTEQKYTIAGGKLTLVDDEYYDCQNEQWSGSSSSFIGTWSDLAYVDNSEASENCDDVSMPFTVVNSQMVVTASSMTMSGTVKNFCAADLFADEMGSEMPTTKKDCKTLEMDMGTGSSVTMTIDKMDLSSGEMQITFSSSEGSCVADMSEPTSSAECANGGSGDEALYTCLMQVMGVDVDSSDDE